MKSYFYPGLEVSSSRGFRLVDVLGRTWFLRANDAAGALEFFESLSGLRRSYAEVRGQGTITGEWNGHVEETGVPQSVDGFTLEVSFDVRDPLQQCFSWGS